MTTVMVIFVLINFDETMNHKKDNDKRDKIVFCTECGASLDDYALSDEALDPKNAEANFKNCRKTGKFKGEVCSKLFIAQNFEFPPAEEEDYIF